MEGSPSDYVGSRSLPSQGYDDNVRYAPTLMAAIIDPLTKEVIGYLPFKMEENEDGTATLVVVV